MSGRRASESSVASDGDSAPPTRKHRSHNRAKSSAHAGPQQQIPQPWYPPTYHPYYQPPVPLAANPLASYPYPTAPQAANSRWDGVLDLFDEEAQDRRKKGKELIPFGPMMNGPLPPWAAYPGDYVRGPPYGTWGNTGWPGSPTQPAQLPLPRLQGGEHPSRKTIKHVHHDDQQSRTRRKRHQSPHQEITLGRQVDAILTPDSGDLTVHLTMDLGEDLEHHLDELNRLSRLGNFSAARELFDEHLRHHIDNPYVLVQYADMLYNQGDFKGVTMLKDDSLYTRDGEMPDSEELRILRSNWELLQILAKSYTLENLSGVPATLEEAVAILTDMAKGGSSDRSISSIEIEILALTIRLSGHPVLNSKWSRYGSRALAAISMSLLQLYQILLRQGRIWDLHDLVVLMPTMEDIKALTHDIFGKDLIPSLQTMISDWSDSVHGYDASTTLGLLSILTHILLEPVAASEKECIEILKLCLPLAISAAENDPSNLKSRPYLRLLLAKSRFAETASRQAVESLRAHLHSSQGILFEVDIALLPIYVPSGSESPKWTPIDQPSELRNPVRLIMRSAMDLGDMKTELLARREFIRLSASPQDEFNALCDLQLSRQGDLNGYSSSLASKYLVSTTTTAKDDLAIAISRLLSRVASTDYWESSYEWILTMLLYKLEGRSPSTIQHMFKRNNTDYQNMEESLLRDISRKMPELKDWADQRQVENSARTKLRSAALRASSGSRRNVRSPARQHKSPTARRAAEQPNELLPALGSERKAERPVSFYGSKPSNGQQAQVSSPMAAAARFLSIGNGPQGNADQPREDQETPSSRHAKLQSHPHGLPPPVIKIIERHQDNDTREIEIREKLEAEYNQKLEAEKESRRERRNERMAILEGVKQGMILRPFRRLSPRPIP
ncbi:hypothetical protein F4777DRAFT_370414 [Nemania sp. FL0916]|nr:hypothetical protein F4777DRAFT_370414 [Nemania sp. FL0916]